MMLLWLFAQSVVVSMEKRKLLNKLYCLIFGHQIVEEEVTGFVYLEPNVYIPAVILIRYCTRCGKVFSKKVVRYFNTTVTYHSVN